ncbi:RNA polymerase sigma factor [Carboxylicivirga caseinilyticus]|uniref:RNA polymerase sigma factor n=1 Tax=Carboxylicivirga caseinilyticus TaxID=3417572 RepID=UPI003D33D9ED|nr:sigma-70 family RNA polymerase sigma factor [Marinilabiliaceae bacterium A049]
MIQNFFKIKPLSDDLLLKKFQETQNLDFLGQLYERYMHLVYGVCLKYLKNKEEAQDAVMGIFEKLNKEIPGKEINDFKPWLYVVAKNYCLMQLRKEQSLKKNSSEYEKSELLFMETEEPLHHTNNWEPDAMDIRLKECLEKLKDRQRSCIELFYFNELCYKEISEKLTLDVKKVKSYIQNGKRNLKNCIESKA